MAFVPIEEVQARLPELLAKLIPGEELFITQEDRAIAKLIALPRRGIVPKIGGSKDKLIILDDSDDHLEDFKEYM